MKIDIDNYSGPLEVLLDLAKMQKVDLTSISITQLADQYINFINKEKKIKLDIAAEYLLMATWLAYLKSKLLLPQEDDEEFKAIEVAEKLKLQLKKLELIRLLSDRLLKKMRLGFEIRTRGMHGGIRLLTKSEYRISLYELLKAYSNTLMKRNFQTMNIPKLPFCTTEQAIEIIRRNIKNLNDWRSFTDFIPKNFKNTSKLKKSGIAGFFSASLELTKEGLLEIMQKKSFENILIKEKK
jgi:segregation and condensation protein A